MFGVHGAESKFYVHEFPRARKNHLRERCRARTSTALFPNKQSVEGLPQNSCLIVAPVAVQKTGRRTAMIKPRSSCCCGCCCSVRTVQGFLGVGHVFTAADLSYSSTENGAAILSKYRASLGPRVDLAIGSCGLSLDNSSKTHHVRAPVPRHFEHREEEEVVLLVMMFMVAGARAHVKWDKRRFYSIFSLQCSNMGRRLCLETGTGSKGCAHQAITYMHHILLRRRPPLRNGLPGWHRTFALLQKTGTDS